MSDTQPQNDDPRGSKLSLSELRLNGIVACAECRRLKIKCNRKIPCCACVQRNKAGICPNDTLSLNQDNRFIIASTGPLHERVEQLGRRIQHLENAISKFQSTTDSPGNSEPHPLLTPELLKIKYSVDALTRQRAEENNPPPLPEQFLDSFGTLTIGEDGTGRYLGRSGGTESLIMEEANAETRQDDRPAGVNLFPELYRDLPRRMGPMDHRALDYVYSFLPERDDALHLVDLYVRYGIWVFQPVPPEQILTETLPLVYQYASSTSDKRERFNKVSPHKLALLFALFALASLLNSSIMPFSDSAQRWYQLSRLALSLKSVLETREIETVQTLALLGIYNGTLPGDSSPSTWSYTSLASTLAHAMGMHRDISGPPLRHVDVQRRRLLFWELIGMNTLYSIVLGRPGSIRMSEVDCPFPEDRDQILDHNLEPQPGHLRFKHEFCRDVFTSIIDLSETTTIPSYDAVLDLERRVNEKIPPYYCQISESLLHLKQSYPKMSREDFMKGKLAVILRAITFLHIHRPYFVTALVEHREEPLKSVYAPSFLAGFRAASHIVDLRSTMTHSAYSTETPSIWSVWSYLLTAAIMLGSIPLCSPSSSVAPIAFKNFATAIDLFKEVSGNVHRARLGLAALNKLWARTQEVFLTYRMSKITPSSTPNLTHVPLPELETFFGRTKVINLKRTRAQTDDNDKQQPVGLPAPPPPLLQRNVAISSWNPRMDADRHYPYPHTQSSSLGGATTLHNHPNRQPNRMIDSAEQLVLSNLLGEAHVQPFGGNNGLYIPSYYAGLRSGPSAQPLPHSNNSNSRGNTGMLTPDLFDMLFGNTPPSSSSQWQGEASASFTPEISGSANLWTQRDVSWPMLPKNVP